MSNSQTDNPTSRKPLRLWPGVVLAIIVVLGRYVAPPILPDVEIFELPLGLIAIFAGMLGALGIIVWWMFFSRAAWVERVAAVILIIVAVVSLRPIVHVSVRTGNMGYMLYFYATPILCLAIVVWAVATRRFSNRIRRASLVAAIVLASVPFVVIRTAGVSGTGAELHWRWTPTPEERLLAQAKDEPKPVAPAPAPPAPTPPAEIPGPPPAKVEDKPAAVPLARVAPKDEPTKTEPAATTVGTRAEWPGFRGRGRDGVIRGVRIETDWSKSPPVQLWRRPIGPGWSSFAVQGDVFYTQEQRGDDEIVAAYKLTTGEPVWRHRDAARFWESNAGPGPRGTPTLSNGRVYALGATGILNALDASNGAVVWSRSAVTDTGVTIPLWGIASSPLVVNDLVVVATSGRLAAYDVATGKPRWIRRTAGGGYSSPHLRTIDGVAQILLTSGGGATGVAPADGTVLWQHPGPSAVGIVQPAVTENGDVLFAPADAMGGLGMRRLALTRGPGGWKVEERWTSRGLKPYFNDFVVHEGHAYGFDGSILSCIDLADGARKWKGGRYGQGQLVLLSDQDVLLVLSEDGELALVSATPDKHTELARITAIEGKTWNHPVVVGDVLLVRNGEEMAAFRLSLAGSMTESR
jgi:outer membrane protein assembly factor BamB